MDTPDSRPAFPFRSGQRVRHSVTGQVGIVQGWSWTESRQRDGSLHAYWVMGVRIGPADEPTRQSVLQSMLDGWVADPPRCPGIDLPCGAVALYNGFCARHSNERSHAGPGQPDSHSGAENL